MATIEGQIGPLKEIKEVLKRNGIDTLNNIADINKFNKNYEDEKSVIHQTIESEFDDEINQFNMDLLQYQTDYDNLKKEVTDTLNQEINDLAEKSQTLKDKSQKSFFHKLFCLSELKKIQNKKEKLDNDYKELIRQKKHSAHSEIVKIQNKLDNYRINRQALLSYRAQQSINRLEKTKEVINSLKDLIAGAIGENLVVGELQKLPDNFHVFNDCKLRFYPPIYNKNDDDKIVSIQIDHLLICPAGIFVIETKNWSQHSIENIDLMSPVKQIMRSNYALFTLLNSQANHDIGLKEHHFGSKKISVKNVIVMTNAKPSEEFNFVKILSHNKISRFFNCLKPIFNDEEIENICNYLRMKMNSH